MRKKNLFLATAIFLLTIVFVLIYFNEIGAADSPKPINTFSAKMPVVYYNETSNWYYLDIGGSYIGFNKNDGSIGFSKGSELIGELIPTPVVKYVGKWYLCPILNPDVDSKSAGGDNIERYLNYSGSKNATCYQYDNYGVSANTIININEIKINCNLGNCKLSSNITFTQFIPQDSGFGYIVIPLNASKFRYAKYEDKVIDLSKAGKITNISYILNFEFMDEAVNSTISIWEWEDMLTPQTAVDLSAIQTHFEVLQIAGKKGLLAGTYGYGALSNIVVDPTQSWNSTTTCNFNNPDCWSSGAVPVAGDDVVFNASGTANVNITNNSLPQNLNSFLVDAGYTGTIYFEPLFAVGEWTGTNTGSMLWNVTNDINISGGVMKISGDFMTNDTNDENTNGCCNITDDGHGQEWRSVSGNITIGAGAELSGVGLGFVALFGFGHSGTGTGGTYGGKGGLSANEPYGNATAPTSLGSGGASTAGGSAIKLEAVDLIEVQGIINMSGISSLNSGSGGSVWLKADNISGVGTLKASGGATTIGYGAGGGGRIRLEYRSALEYTGILEIASITTGTSPGREGTLTFSNNTWPGDWYVNGSIGLLGGDYGEGNVTNILGDFVLGDGYNITIYGDCFYNVSDTDLCYNISQDGSGVWINASGNITISSGSILTGAGLGFPADIGPGTGGSVLYYGGTYGGKGGKSTAATYGSEQEPTALGSGGDGADGGDGGRGGSAIKLETNNGIIIFDGDANVIGTGGYGGGSGGSIWLKADNITGSGVLKANGNGSTSTQNTYGSGGGRISLTADSVVEFSGTIENIGGIPINNSKIGSGGTVYINASTSIISTMNISTVGENGGNITFVDTLITLTGVYNASNLTEGSTWETIILNYTDCINLDLTGAVFEPTYTNQSACTAVDATFPTLTIDYPANQTYSTAITEFNFTASDETGLDSCWYSNDTGLFNSTINNCLSNFTGISLSDGQTNLTIWANDTSNNEQTASVVFIQDTKFPTFSNYLDDNASLVGSGAGNFSVDIIDTNGTVFLFINNSNYTAEEYTTGKYNASVDFDINDTWQYYWISYSNFSQNQNTSEDILLFYTINNTDTTAPTITLDSPANDIGEDKNVSFNFSLSDSSNIANCSLILNEAINQTNTSIVKEITQVFELTELEAGNYNWSINCTDEYNNEGESEIRSFGIVITTSFSGSTTDLSQVNITNITNLVLDNPDHGVINFSEDIDLSSGADINSYVNISFNRIEINSTSLPSLNKTATLIIYNLTFTTPQILKDGEACPSTICTQNSYSGGMLDFNVTSFSIYSTQETPSSGGSSGGGGGGGGASVVKVECKSDSDCKVNQTCFENKCYNYECYKDSDCGEGQSCSNYRCIKLFDVKIINTDSPIKSGQFFNFTYLMKGMASVRGDVIVNFWIEKNGKTASSGSDTIYLGNFEEKTETTSIFVPADTPIGNYDFYVQLDYQGHMTKAHRIIEVEEKGTEEPSLIIIQKDYKFYLVPALIGFAAFIFCFIFYWERKRIRAGIIYEEKWLKKHRISVSLFVIFVILGILAYYLSSSGIISLPVKDFFVYVFSWVKYYIVYAFSWIKNNILIYLSPGNKYFYYVIGSIACLIILAAVIFALLRRKKKFKISKIKIKKENKYGKLVWILLIIIVLVSVIAYLFYSKILILAQLRNLWVVVASWFKDLLSEIIHFVKSIWVAGINWLDNFLGKAVVFIQNLLRNIFPYLYSRNKYFYYIVASIAGLIILIVALVIFLRKKARKKFESKLKEYVTKHENMKKSRTRT